MFSCLVPVEHSTQQNSYLPILCFGGSVYSGISYSVQIASLAMVTRLGNLAKRGHFNQCQDKWKMYLVVFSSLCVSFCCSLHCLSMPIHVVASSRLQLCQAHLGPPSTTLLMDRSPGVVIIMWKCWFWLLESRCFLRHSQEPLVNKIVPQQISAWMHSLRSVECLLPL